MDYSVGSLADLISGSKTPNKTKVSIKQIKKSPKKEVENLVENNSNDDVNSHNTSFINKKNKFKKELVSNEAEDQEVPKKKVKKNKLKKNKTELNVSSELNDSFTSNNVTKKRTLSKDSSNSKKVKKIKVLSPEEGEGNEKTNEKKSVNDINAEHRINRKAKQVRLEEVFPPEENRRTLFVGNVPISVNKSKLTRFFSKYGKVEAVRFRGVPVADPKTPKKVAVIRKEFHPDRSSYLAFVRFEKREDAVKALEANGILYKDHHLRCHLSDDKSKPDESKAIFVGNLAFNVEDEELWKLFEPCGEIDTVRIVRDARTGMGKGFAYVNFKTSDSVQIALEMENMTLKNRELRISLCNINAAKKNKKLSKPKQISEAGKPKSKRLRKNKEGGVTQNDEIDEKPQSSIKADYQGSRFPVKKKKNKPNKGLLQKKKIIKKFAPKTSSS